MMRFVLILHSHLPWVLHHGRWPHGSDWLSEAAVDTYLPLLAALDHAEQTGVATPFTLGITPVLAAQLAEPMFRSELEGWFAHRFEALAEAPAALRASGDEALLPLVPHWQAHLTAMHNLWRRHEGDLITAFRRHMEAGRIELISSAATHGFLPLLARDESIRLQLLTGRAEHLRHFGVLPTGCWLPECAYRPRGPWQPWPSAPGQPVRRGIEEHLRHAGFRWFTVDSHLADAGEAWEVYEAVATRPVMPSTRSPYRAYEVGSRPAGRGRPVHVVVRDPRTTAQVWSRYGGYPGDGRYLEFHKIRYPGGLKFWAVTSPSSDLADKARYRPEAAAAAVEEHADHFRGLLGGIIAAAGPGDGAIVAPFDTELFGHWWHEGVDFLAALYDGLHRDAAIPASTAGGWLKEMPPTTSIRMQEGSWGANGDFSKWLNHETAWTWERLWPLEGRFWELVPAALARPELSPVLEQAARELLLAQSSDWQFIISTGAAGDYATERFVGHCEALEDLLSLLESPDTDPMVARARAAALQQIDGPFPSLLGAIAAASDVTAP
jgi:1,4-alpha-glucan branching enzyme